MPFFLCRDVVLATIPLALRLFRIVVAPLRLGKVRALILIDGAMH